MSAEGRPGLWDCSRGDPSDQLFSIQVPPQGSPGPLCPVCPREALLPVGATERHEALKGPLRAHRGPFIQPWLPGWVVATGQGLPWTRLKQSSICHAGSWYTACPPGPHAPGHREQLESTPSPSPSAQQMFAPGLGRCGWAGPVKCQLQPAVRPGAAHVLLGKYNLLSRNGEVRQVCV